MYANLRVSVDDEFLAMAWKVEVRPRLAIVYRDKQDGMGSHFVEDGVVRVDTTKHEVVVVADF